MTHVHLYAGDAAQSDEYVMLLLNFVFLLFSMGTCSWGGSDGGGGGQNGYNLRSTLPGEPDVDYPILGRIPETSFKCQGRHDGE